MARDLLSSDLLKETSAEEFTPLRERADNTKEWSAMRERSAGSDNRIGACAYSRRRNDHERLKALGSPSPYSVSQTRPIDHLTLAEDLLGDVLTLTIEADIFLLPQEVTRLSDDRRNR